MKTFFTDIYIIMHEYTFQRQDALLLNCVSLTSKRCLDSLSVGVLCISSAMTCKNVEEVIDLVLIIYSHFSRTLSTLDWVIDLFFIHPTQSGVSQSCFSFCLRLSLCWCGHVVLTTLLPALLLLFCCFILQHFILIHCTVHHKHGSVLRPVFLMSVCEKKNFIIKAKGLWQITVRVIATSPLTVQT